MRTRWILPSLLVLPALLAAEVKSPPKGWKDYHPQDKSFTVWLPDQGGRKSERTRTMAVRGVRLKLNLVQVQPPRGPIYNASTVLLSPRLARQLSKSQRIELFRDAFVNMLKGRVTQDNDIMQGQIPGKEYLIQPGQGMARLRLLTSGSRIYQALVAGTKDQVESKDADTFLESFSVPTRTPVARKNKSEPDAAKTDNGTTSPKLDKKGQEKTSTSTALAAGKIMGADFKVEKVELNVTGALTLQQGKGFFPDTAILIFLPDRSTDAIQGKTYVKANGIFLKRLFQGEKLPKTESFATGYTLKLEFGKAQDGQIPGKIDVRLPDANKSFVRGTFTVPAR